MRSSTERREPARPARSWFVWPSDERGSVTVLVAMSMTALIGLLALGIDLGGLFNARSEAQRAADAAALAGASALIEYPLGEARQPAEEWAIDFATSNEIRNQAIEREEVSVWVDLDASTVRAAVRRDDVPTWFARVLGFDAVDVGAEATAWAGEAGAAQCLKPFAVPDMWEETNDDLNGNRIWDEGERWSYDPAAGDRYSGYSGGAGSNETGYGSSWRNGQVDADGRRYSGDYGRRVTVKVTNPREAWVSSFFLPWVLPEDGGQSECGSQVGGGGGGVGGGRGGGGGAPDEPPGGGGPFGWLKWSEKREDLGVSGGQGQGQGQGQGNQGGNGEVGRDDGSGRGAAAYRRNICSCNRSVIDLDTEYLIEPGNMVGPTFQGVQQLIALDPDAYWDEQSNTIVSQYGPDSPRVITVALFNPAEIDSPGRQYIRFNNFARVFLEEQVDRRDPVTGRFLYYVRGIGGGEGRTTGSLVRTLQLIR